MNWTVRNVLAITIMIVWSLAALASILTKDFTTLGAVTPVMMIVAGFLFGAKGNGSSQSEKK